MLEAPWIGNPPEDEEIVAFRCDECKEDILVGEEFYDIDGFRCCEDCGRDWLETFRRSADYEE